jgi:crotonobetaine/carnitine-CoA ligase
VRTPHPVELRTLPAMLRHHAAESPGRVFLTDGDGTLTRLETLELAERAAAGWRALGVEQGETVALMLDNCRELLLAWFGLATRGAIEVPVNPEFTGERLAHVLNHSQSRVLVVAAEYVERIDDAADRLDALERLVVVGDATSRRFPTTPFEEILTADPGAPFNVRFSDPVAVMYTSGSTGPAKGVVLPHGQHYTNGFQPASLLDITENDVVFVCLPLHHNMAQGYGIWPALVAGASVRLAPRFDRATFWADVKASGTTVFPFVGAMLVLLGKLPPSAAERNHAVRAAFGVPIPGELHELLQERFGIRLVHGYGSTEATIVAWNTRPDWVPGACGPVVEGFELRIVGEHDLALPPGELGEICVRPREPYSMFSGYFREPEKTVAAWRNLWFHTGDRGRIDERGDLWFGDRMGDVIRSRGEFVSAREIEEAVLAHPEVALVAAYGVPSELTEEEIMVAVIRQGCANVSAQDLVAWCASRLPPFAVPRYVELVDELPMTATGKIEKYKLKARGAATATFDARAAR